MNMSYCQFHNTSIDLDQCLNTIEDGNLEDLSSMEKSALSKLLSTQFDRLRAIREDIESEIQNELTYENCLGYLNNLEE